MNSEEQGVHHLSRIERNSLAPYDIRDALDWETVEFGRFIYDNLLNHSVHNLQSVSEIRNMTVKAIQLFPKLTRNKLIIMLRADPCPFDAMDDRIASTKTETIRLVENQTELPVKRRIDGFDVVKCKIALHRSLPCSRLNEISDQCTQNYTEQNSEERRIVEHAQAN